MSVSASGSRAGSGLLTMSHLFALARPGHSASHVLRSPIHQEPVLHSSQYSDHCHCRTVPGFAGDSRERRTRAQAQGGGEGGMCLPRSRSATEPAITLNSSRGDLALSAAEARVAARARKTVAERILCCVSGLQARLD